MEVKRKAIRPAHQAKMLAARAFRSRAGLNALWGQRQILCRGKPQHRQPMVAASPPPFGGRHRHSHSHGHSWCTSSRASTRQKVAAHDMHAYQLVAITDSQPLRPGYKSGNPMQGTALWSQSASFWVGSLLVAEAPAALLVSLLSEKGRESQLDFAVFSTTGPAISLSTPQHLAWLSAGPATGQAQAPSIMSNRLSERG